MFYYSAYDFSDIITKRLHTQSAFIVILKFFWYNNNSLKEDNMKKSTKAGILAAIAGMSFLALGCQEVDKQDAGDENYYAVTFSADKQEQ